MYPLGKQFEFNLDKGVVDERYVIKGSNYRFSVLSERLIRLEYQAQGEFSDGLTELVQNRQFKAPIFSVKNDPKILKIITKYFTLEYLKEKPFLAKKSNPTNYLRVTVNETNPPKVWYYTHPEARNFLGGKISFDSDSKLEKGLYSQDGFVSFDDSKNYIINNDGVLTPKSKDYIDIYLFVYKNDFELALKDYMQLTGFPALIPRYALGNWWEREKKYNEQEIIDLVENFKNRNIPLAVFLCDDNWHIKDNEGTRNLVSGFSFNPSLFPDPRNLISNLHQRNIRLGVQINPKNGIYPYETYYHKAIEYLKIEAGKIIAFDPLNPLFLDVYFKMFIHPLEDLGVDFFWNDYYERDKGLYLWMLNHYHFYDLTRNETKRGIILGRNALIATHRYPVTYSGKTIVSWDTLKSLPTYNMMCANIGVSWISHDVGGNHGGVEDSELYIRYLQFATFSPILRFSAGDSHYYKREPWLWDIKTETIANEYLRLRHQLIPYLYTEAYYYYKEGVPLIKPLYYTHPFAYDDLIFKNEYFFGREMFVAPILNKKDEVMNRTVQKFYIPAGIWYDFKTGKKFLGDNKYVSFYKDEDYPIFVQSGGIIPLSIKSGENNITNPTDLDIHIFPGVSNKYVLYEDDGVSSLYNDGYYLQTEIEYNYLANNYTVIIHSIEGKSGIVPEKRNYRIKFRNTKLANDVVTYFNENKVDTNNYILNNDFIVEINDVPTVGQLTINCKGKDIEIDALRVINDDIESILMDLPIETVMKEKISTIIFSDMPIKKKRIAIRKMRMSGLRKEHMKLFLKLLEYIEEI